VRSSPDRPCDRPIRAKIPGPKCAPRGVEGPGARALARGPAPPGAPTRCQLSGTASCSRYRRRDRRRLSKEQNRNIYKACGNGVNPGKTGHFQIQPGMRGGTNRESRSYWRWAGDYASCSSACGESDPVVTQDWTPAPPSPRIKVTDERKRRAGPPRTALQNAPSAILCRRHGACSCPALPNARSTCCRLRSLALVPARRARRVRGSITAPETSPAHRRNHASGARKRVADGPPSRSRGFARGGRRAHWMDTTKLNCIALNPRARACCSECSHMRRAMPLPVEPAAVM
jgi:hypothetical protein